MKTKQKYCVITGATSGIGFESSVYLAQLGYSLILIARNKSKLLEMKSNLEEIYKIDCIIIISDLSVSGACTKISNYITKEKLNVYIVMCNAGFGDYGDFKDSSYSKTLEMMELNMTSVVDLTYQLLPKVILSKGHILFVSSIAGFIPIPYMSVYAATKSFILSLSLSLREELKPFNVNVSVLCPGPTKTAFFNKANAQKISSNQKLMSARDVARIGVDAMFKQKSIIVPTFKLKLMIFMRRCISLSLLTKISGTMIRLK
ncbi:MAG: SDR family NAD(P)-dependent oxidoreductase [Nanoarchaeota archaeon]|nr:SDR family NAD(P)-dependent oxidoreductase [Nanoarchaeota archaeon]